MILLIILYILVPYVTIFLFPALAFRKRKSFFIAAIFHILSVIAPLFFYFRNYMLFILLAISIFTFIILFVFALKKNKNKKIKKRLLIIVSILHLTLWSLNWQEFLAQEGIIKTHAYQFYETNEMYKVQVSRMGGIHNIFIARAHLFTYVVSNKNLFLKNKKQINLGGYRSSKEVKWDRLDKDKVIITLSSSLKRIDSDTFYFPQKNK